MNRKRDRLGFTVVELAVVLLVVVLLVATAVPVVAGSRGNSGVQQSMSNLVAQSAAHLIYAADWNGRQVTHNPDDVGVYGTIDDYNDAHGCTSNSDPNCHPPIIAGFGPLDDYSWTTWAYWPLNANGWFEAINFPGGPNGSAFEGFGMFRFPQSRPIHDYLNGRYHDPLFYAPNDTAVNVHVQACWDTVPEFDPDCNENIFTSYCRSPAAIFHPDVMRSNAAGGWQAPWELDHGYETPGLFQATYPDLKTHIIEHSWLQGPPAECNPAFFGCTPYFFNAGIDSSPLALFFDGHVRLLPNSEVLLADFQVLAQTKQVDGLWHRATPFGASGYFIESGFDGVPLSHHILTTDGILGRDTLGEASPVPSSVRWQRPFGVGNRRPHVGLQTSVPDVFPTPAEDLP
jgi:type II secretory pathway pseudopilin PulG